MLLLLEKIHGHFALLAIALCYHPFFALRKARRPAWGTRLSGYLATGGLSATIVLGWVIYPEYRLQIRQHLYLEHRWLGLSFEFKEHIGTFAVAFVLAGAVLMWFSGRDRLDALTPAIRALYGSAAVMATLSALIGIYLASVKSFPYALQ